MKLKLSYYIVFVFSSLFSEIVYKDFTNNITDIAIIGAGPAGLTAACNAGRSGYHTTLITGDVIGGQLLGARLVENMPGVLSKPGYEIVEDMKKQAEIAGAHFLYDTVIEINKRELNGLIPITLASGFVLYARTAILATGGLSRKLEIPGEEKYWSKGVYACALCDCFAVQNLDAAIIGGGNAAVEEALMLAPYAKNITIFVRKNKMRAGMWLQEQLAAYPHISIVYTHEILEILGDEEKMTGLRIRNNETEKESIFPVQGLFLAIGYKPNTSLFKNLFPLTEDGYIPLTSRNQQTIVPGIFVAGEIVQGKFKQVGVETGFAVQAALEAADYLRENGITYFSSALHKSSYFF